MADERVCGKRSPTAEPSGRRERILGPDGPARPGDPQVFTTLAWRLCHITEFLTADRNGRWLASHAERVQPGSGAPRTSAEALEVLESAYAVWSGLLAGMTDDALEHPIGEVAGPYAGPHEGLRLPSCELIHHGAEAALLRDLYPRVTVARE